MPKKLLLAFFLLSLIEYSHAAKKKFNCNPELGTYGQISEIHSYRTAISHYLVLLKSIQRAINDPHAFVDPCVGDTFCEGRGNPLYHIIHQQVPKLTSAQRKKIDFLIQRVERLLMQSEINRVPEKTKKERWQKLAKKKGLPFDESNPPRIPGKFADEIIIGDSFTKGEKVSLQEFISDYERTEAHNLSLDFLSPEMKKDLIFLGQNFLLGMGKVSLPPSSEKTPYISTKIIHEQWGSTNNPKKLEENLLKMFPDKDIHKYFKGVGAFYAQLISCGQSYLVENTPSILHKNISSDRDDKRSQALSLFVGSPMASNHKTIPQYFAWKVIHHSALKNKIPFLVQFFDFDKETGNKKIARYYYFSPKPETKGWDILPFSDISDKLPPGQQVVTIDLFRTVEGTSPPPNPEKFMEWINAYFASHPQYSGLRPDIDLHNPPPIQEEDSFIAKLSTFLDGLIQQMEKNMVAIIGPEEAQKLLPHIQTMRSKFLKTLLEINQQENSPIVLDDEMQALIKNLWQGFSHSLTFGLKHCSIYNPDRGCVGHFRMTNPQTVLPPYQRKSSFLKIDFPISSKSRKRIEAEAENIRSSQSPLYLNVSLPNDAQGWENFESNKKFLEGILNTIEKKPIRNFSMTLGKEKLSPSQIQKVQSSILKRSPKEIHTLILDGENVDNDLYRLLLTKKLFTSLHISGPSQAQNATAPLVLTEINCDNLRSVTFFNLIVQGANQRPPAITHCQSLNTLTLSESLSVYSLSPSVLEEKSKMYQQLLLRPSSMIHNLSELTFNPKLIQTATPLTDLVKVATSLKSLNLFHTLGESAYDNFKDLEAPLSRPTTLKAFLLNFSDIALLFNPDVEKFFQACSQSSNESLSVNFFDLKMVELQTPEQYQKAKKFHNLCPQDQSLDQLIDRYESKQKVEQKIEECLKGLEKAEPRASTEGSYSQCQ